MKKFYLLTILGFLFFRVSAQECSALQFTYGVTESRCVSTGSIEITATGGSGDYNYRAVGPVVTPFTSSNLITGLPPGYYVVVVNDITTGCNRQQDSVYIPGSYSDPRFQLTKTDATCAGNDGTIRVINQQFGRSPFTYTIVAPSPFSIGTSNTTGEFTGLTAGEYSIQLQDSCGGIQVRNVTIESYNWWFDSTSIEKIDCDNAHAFIRLSDNKGNNNITGTAFDGFTYGVVVKANDTLWNNNHSFSFLLGKKRNLTIVVKDNCGNVHFTPWSLPNDVKPTIGNVELSYFTCTNFKASMSNSVNLSSAEYCLYDSLGVLLDCNKTGIFPDLSYGSYCMKISDICYDTVITRCFVSYAPVPAVAADVDISNKDCSSFTATITGQQNLINPVYCLTNARGDKLSCNKTGVFNKLAYDSYCINITNGCSDTTITRCFTATPPIPVITGYSTGVNSCTTFNLTAYGNNLFNPLYCLYDSAGKVIACDSSGKFTGIQYGGYCIRAISCGDTTAAFCFTGTRPEPYISWIQTSNRTCTGFTATVTGLVNIISPKYCLYNAADSLLACNSNGVFTNLAYGSYCVKVKDSCTDSTITSCFAEKQPVRSVNSNVQQTNSTCTGFTATVTSSDFFSPQYCAYDAQNNLVLCNTTGIFNNLPYGSYCFSVRDGCIDTTIRVCKTFTSVRGLSVTATKSCSLGSSDITIQFATSNAPYRIKIFNPNGLIRFDTVTYSNPFQVKLPALAASAQYKIVGIDACNQKDTSFIAPAASQVTRDVTVKSKCPSATYQNGAGDITVNCSSNFYSVQPKIIKKDKANFHKNHSFVSGDTYTFSDLEPATYVIEYKMQSCNTRLYDTVTVEPYRFPSQGKSAIYECDNTSLSLSGDVNGGVTPYTFQIIGSIPAAPSVTTPAQKSAVFNINNGTRYSLIRLRAVDACGNATLNDVSILPLQNISVKASQECFYQNTLLTADTIPNATYEWYYKRSASDSTLIGDGLSYNLPFFEPEQAGEYVCKVNVNDGCLTRINSFALDGDCGYNVLPVAIRLKGKAVNKTHQLSWEINEEKSVAFYIIERKTDANNSYKEINRITTRKTPGSQNYFYTDPQPSPGDNQYRIRLLYTNGQSGYSNTITIFEKVESKVYPNPVKDQLYILLHSSQPSDFVIELFDLAGKQLYNRQVNAVSNGSFVYKREKNINKGMYLLKVTNRNTSTVEIHKILMD